jgi:hypothetical protein
MCFVWMSEQTASFALYSINRWVLCNRGGQRVYSAVRTESLYKTDTLRLYKGLIKPS